MSTRFQKIDAEGHLVSDEGARLEDEHFGKEFLSSLRLTESFQLRSDYKRLDLLVEAFDQPFVVKHVELTDDKIRITLPYGHTDLIRMESFGVDEWDRFHGMTMGNIPFVFSRQAQMEFFDLLEEFDDDSITIFGKKYPTPPYFIEKTEVNQESFWSDIYRTEEPGWDLKEPTDFIPHVLPQLKLSKQRILVPGCGRGHDAAYLAKQGHLVTAVDFSPEAIRDAKAKYGEIPGLEFIEADVFDLPKENFGPFDLIFEHTCFCAISPQRRNELVKVWKKHLTEDGHLLGVFFVMSKRIGPPFGASEWEVKERLKSHFDFRYWTRWRNSRPRRQGNELVVYAQKRKK